MPTGRVVLVGAGPGDPSLITVRALEALKRAEVVVFDRLANPQLLSHAPVTAEFVDVGKLPGDHKVAQDAINRLLVEKARAGKLVVRLKGGDPFVFGRGGEEILALAEAGIPFEVIPGITAGIAGPAYAGIPVTHRGHASCVTFVTGHEDPAKPGTSINWKALASTGGTLVFYMGVKELPRIVASLVAEGMAEDTPAACIERATTPQQRSVRGTLADIAEKVADAGFKPPAVTVVGSVASLPEALNWFEHRPLFGRRIVVTRPREQADDLASPLASLGADVILFPTIEIAPPPTWDEVDAAIAKMSGFDWVIFTSANGVRGFCERVLGKGLDSRVFAGVSIACIGSATGGELARFGLRPDFVPSEFTSAQLLKELRAKCEMKGKRVLLPRTDIAREELRDGLRALGAHVTEVTTYLTRTALSPDPAVVEAVRAGRCDIVAFTSPSTVKGFVEIIGAESVRALAGSVKFASIGPVTTREAEALGLAVDIEAADHTAAGLARAIRDKSSGPALT